jgi:hypothetical protein
MLEHLMQYRIVRMAKVFGEKKVGKAKNNILDIDITF